MNEFFFLMCSERSGSNLLTRMMDAHPEVCGPSPTHLFRQLIHYRDHFQPLEEEANWLALTGYAFDLFNAKLGEWKSRPSIEQLRSSVRPGDLVGLLRYIYRQEAEATEARHIFVKENRLWSMAPFLVEHFSPVKIVFMVRDPRDMALSWKRAPAMRGGIVRACRVWKKDQAEAQRLSEGAVPGCETFHLRYEDLVTDPATTLRELCAFLELRYCIDMLDFSDSNRAQIDAGQVAEWKNLSSGLMQGNFNKYRNGLPQREIRYIESLCFDAMLDFGYQPEYRPMAQSELDMLGQELAANEPNDKPEYMNLPETERNRRARQAEVLNRLARGFVPVADTVDTSRPAESGAVAQ